MTGMILAAGLGTRLAPLTEKVPKALVEVRGYKMMDMAIQFLTKHGVDKIVVNVHHLADQMMEYVAEKRWQGYHIEISDETSMLLNTGGALKKAEHLLSFEEDFVLMAVDVLTDLDLSEVIKEHNKQKNLVTLAVKERITSRSLTFNKDMLLSGWKHNQTGEIKAVEGREPVHSYGFSGIHVVNKRIFEYIPTLKPFSIIDLYLNLAESEKISAFVHNNSNWLEFGKIDSVENPDAKFDELIKKLYI